MIRITISELKRVIKRVLSEAGAGAASNKPMFSGTNQKSNDVINREQLGYLADQDTDTMNSEGDEDLPSHLRYPEEDFEDDYGPVPPTESGNMYTVQDPLTKDVNVRSHSAFNR